MNASSFSPVLKSINELTMVSSNSGVDNAEIISMISKLKEKYVDQIHPIAITHIASGKKAGKWKTRIKVSGPNGKLQRKEIIRSTREELYDVLYDYYQRESTAAQSFQQVFSEYLTYLHDKRNRSSKTIRTYQCTYNRFVTPKFGQLCIASITEDHVLDLVNSRCHELRPKMEALKKFVEQLKATFRYAIDKGYRISNPANIIDLACYYSDCDISRKTAEEKEFSDNEVQILMATAAADLHNPRALMMMLARQTGMRAGELAALRREDIYQDVIHIHSQLLNPTKNAKREPERTYEIVPYTKDEKRHPHGGRYFPVCKEIQTIIDLAEQIPGSSPFLFHDPGSDAPIKKDGYEQYLRRVCERNGFKVTNNHALRMHLNSEFISIGLSAAQRAVLLGHAVETNERCYSLADRRLLAGISDVLTAARNQDASQRTLLTVFPELSA